MKKSLDLDGFVQILSDSGYNGYFTTQAAYPGKIKDSISTYLDRCAKGLEQLKPEISLVGYLQWSGEDKPRVECVISVKHERGNFDLLKMEISRKDQFGQILNDTALTNLSVASLPKAYEAIAMVSDVKHEATPMKRGFKL